MERERREQYRKKIGLSAAALAVAVGLGSELTHEESYIKPPDEGRVPAVVVYRREDADLPNSGVSAIAAGRPDEDSKNPILATAPAPETPDVLMMHYRTATS